MSCSHLVDLLCCDICSSVRSCWRRRQSSTSSATTTSYVMRSLRASCSILSTAWPRMDAMSSTSTSFTLSSRPRASTWRSVRTWSWPRWGWGRDAFFQNPSAFPCLDSCSSFLFSSPTLAKMLSSSTTTRPPSMSCWSWWQRAGRGLERAAHSGNHSHEKGCSV